MATQTFGTLLGWNDYDRVAREAVDPNTPPVEVTEDEYWQMLEVLPPIYVKGGFLVMEAMTGTALGEAHAHYAERGGRFFARYSVRGRAETYIPLDYRP